MRRDDDSQTMRGSASMFDPARILFGIDEPNTQPRPTSAMVRSISRRSFRTCRRCSTRQVTRATRQARHGETLATGATRASARVRIPPTSLKRSPLTPAMGGSMRDRSPRSSNDVSEPSCVPSGQLSSSEIWMRLILQASRTSGGAQSTALDQSAGAAQTRPNCLTAAL